MLDLKTIQSLFKASPAANIILYPDAPSFTIAWLNPAGLLLTGAALTDMVGLSVVEVLADPARDIGFIQNEPLQKSLAQSLHLKCAATVGIQRYRRANQITGGEDLECSTYPLFDEVENVAFLVVNLNVIDQTSVEDQQIKDITARKQNEFTISALNKQHQDLFDLSPVPQFVYSIEDLTFKDVNRAAIANYGYSRADFLSMTIMDIIPPEDIAALEQILNEKVKPGVHYNGILRHVKHTGEIVDVKVAESSMVYDGIYTRLVIAVDITEQTRARMALQQSEQRYKALVQDGSDMVGILNSKGEYLFVNQTAQRILGIPPEFFIGKNAFDFIHEKDQKRFMDTLAQLPHLDSMKIPAFLFRDGEGKYRWIDTTVTNLTADPAVGGIVANSRDVTERIVNEMKIQQSIERFDSVAKATSDAIWDYDATTGSVVWNKAVKTLFGYKVGTYTPAWWEDRIHPDDFSRVNKKMMSVIKGKKRRLKNEYRFRCADNTYKNVLDRSFIIYSDSGEVTRMIGCMEDITARATYVQTVEAQNERLKEIAWTQSHMVRAPLANIIGLIEILTDRMDNDLPNKELIDHLSKSAIELDSTIRAIIKKTEILYTI